MIEEGLSAFIEKMPKIELHLHLEGSIRPDTALELMQRNRDKHAPEKAEHIHRLYQFTSLSDFVKGMRTVSNNIRSLEDLGRITTELLKALAEEQVRYVEFDCAVQKYIDLGFALPDIITAIEHPAREFERSYNLTSRLTVNLLRSHGSQKALKLVDRVAEMDHPFVVGIGLSGDEQNYPQKEFSGVFERARLHGLHRTAHAGEAMDARSVWDAIRYLNVERIDHGTRAIEDESLCRYLAEHKIPLTQCLTSNLRLNIVTSLQDHPFGHFLRKGVLVTLNTDDPQIFNTRLSDEYRLAAETFDLSANDLATIVLNGVEAAFLPADQKANLRTQIKRELNTLIRTLPDV